MLLMSLVSSLFAADQSLLVTATNAQLEEQQKYEAQIVALESEFGPFDNSLLEPLEAMVALFNEQADYEQVAQLQNRQLQLMRTVLGFEHPDLIPLIQSMIANQLKLGEWEAISDNLEHIRHLQAANMGDDPEVLLAAIDDQAFWYLSRSYLDEKDRRVRNFFRAREMYEEMENLAEASFSEDSQEMIPSLYRQAYNKFQLVQFLNASSGIGSASVDRLAREDGMHKLRSRGRNTIDTDALLGWGNRIPVVDGDSLIGEAYLRDGFNLVSRIERILELEGDPEAEAMAKIYRADFQTLRKSGSGMRNYRKAQELLLQAGINEDKINLFFNRPMVIPVDKYFHRLDDAIAYQQQSHTQLNSVPEDQLHLGVFSAWSESVPSTQKPDNSDPFWQLDLPYAEVDVSFSVSSRGGISSVDVIASTPDERGVRRKATRAMREVTLRPAIVKGRGKRMKDVQIRYRFLEE